MIRDIEAFRKRFGLGCPRAPRLLSPEEQELRLTLIDEEVQEFKDALIAQDLPEAADALVDLVYVVLGTAAEMGLPWEELWADVHRANMEKERCKTESDSKRGSTADLMKPPGWKPPNGAAIIARALTRAARLEQAADQKQQCIPGLEELT